MLRTVDVPPFVMTIGSADLTFRFDEASCDQGFENPPNLEGNIARAVETHAGSLADRRVIVDFGDLPAISSKQLGAILTLRRICGDNQTVWLTNTRPNVRELLRVTRLEELFAWT